jgi:daunosaminyl-N,N-dimethyltransferase/N-dimethyltransferase
MDDHRMYGDRAELYDLVYSGRDYAADAERLHGILEAEGVADGGRFLEVACGTGIYLVEFSRWYEVVGLDVSPAMLEIARGKLPDVELLEEDMSDFEVEGAFDAVGCLFSSLGYLRTGTALAGAAASFARALRPGGILLVQPWIFREDWREGEPHLQTYDSEDLKLCRANVAKSEGDEAVLNFHWLVVRRGESIEHFTERHRLRFWTREEMTGAFEEAGFDVRFEPEGRGLFVARRR